MSFLAWCRLQLRREDAVGDFCRDWVADRDRPRGSFSSWWYVHQYLLSVNAIPEAIDAGRRAWAEWRALRGPRP